MAQFKFLPIALVLGICLVSVVRAESDFDHEWDAFSEEEKEPEASEPGPRAFGNSGGGAGLQMPSGAQPSPPGQDGKAGWSGSNYAGHNESCDRRECTPERNFECHSSLKICSCKEDYFYYPLQEKCFKKWFAGAGTTCVINEQCHQGGPGPLSYCQHSSGMCECRGQYSHAVPSKNGTCVYVKKINETCLHSVECEAGAGPNSYCHPGERKCHCLAGSIEIGGECFEVAKDGLNSPCRESRQCTSSTLGPVSRCGEDSKKCECYDSLNPLLMDNAKYYEKNGICYSTKKLDEICTSAEECKASLGERADCRLNQTQGEPVGTMQKSCQCLGKVLEDGTCSGCAISSSLFTMFLALIAYLQLTKQE